MDTETLNLIKKQLYKQNPEAKFSLMKNGVAIYITLLQSGLMVVFEIPVSDMGDATFSNAMEAKFLIRWINKTQ